MVSTFETAQMRGRKQEVRMEEGGEAGEMVIKSTHITEESQQTRKKRKRERKRQHKSEIAGTFALFIYNLFAGSSLGCLLIHSIDTHTCLQGPLQV